MVFITAQTTVFNKEAVEWADRVNTLVEKISGVATKFFPQLKELLEHPELPEQNEALQKRIIGASAHFCAELENSLQQINKCTAVTDSKIVSVDGNKLLAELYQSICLRKHLFAACREGFLINNFLAQKRTFVKQYLSVNMYAGKSTYQKNDSPYPDLYKELRKKRDELCEQKNVPIFMIANGNSLDEMARYLPQTFEELNKITGFGKVKAQQYGEAFLSIINAYCEEKNLHTNMEAMPAKTKRKEKAVEVKTDTKTASFILFKAGKTIAEIATERTFAIATIEGHLAYFVGIGEIDVDHLVSQEKQRAIKNAVAIHGHEVHKTIIENIPTGISYGEVRIVLASIKKVAAQ